MQRLSNDQLAEKMRAANRRRSERQRAKRVEAGRAALTVWIPANLQRQIVELATTESATTSDVAERLLTDGLNYRQLATPRPTPSVEAKTAPESLSPIQPDSTEPANASTFNQDLGAFKTAVADCWNAGVRGYGAIATALNNAGYRNGNGNPYPRSHVKAVLVKAGLVAEKSDKGE
jgi:hypothetical protein